MAKASFITEMNSILDGYAKTIDNVFKLSILPSVTTEAYNQYYKAKNYQLVMADNREKIIKQTGIVKRLEEIKNRLDALRKKLKANSFILTGDNTTQQEQYEAELKPYIDSFARLSSDLVSGDDIAQVDNLAKQVLDEQDYVYNDLLKGPNGCEKELELGKNALGNGIPWQIYDTKRMSYPAPILYDYNTLKGGDLIPDIPGYPEYKNKIGLGGMPVGHIPAFGPGFLSYVFFIKDNITPISGTYRDCATKGTNDLDCPLITNFPLRAWTISLGIVSTDSSNEYNGLFENTIRIY